MGSLWELCAQRSLGRVWRTIGKVTQSALMPVALCSVAVLAATGCGHQTAGTATRPTASASSENAILSGTWTGSYVCQQGETGLRLVIKAAPNGTLSAIFNFYAVPSDPGVPSGSFSMTGTYSAAGVDLNQSRWIREPAGYVMVNLNAGPPTDGGKVLRGNVSYVGCSTFTVRKSGAKGSA